uniref:long-chain-fatty-acid--CoA ligase n=2 Tax=Haemonchus contortus TaxID=6289 RepID=A0A7I4YDX3_HAECO|nr:AMP-dependent synthetase ligase domain containing protein [Haemonchus contortus]
MACADWMVVRKLSQDKYDAKHDEKLGMVVKGSSPLWIRILMGILRIWFFIYDCLNYIPYQLFNSPTEKLRRSSKVKAQWVDARDGPIRHVDGLKTEEFPGKDTVDKVWRHIVELYDEAPALGTRQLLAVHHEKQDGGRVFEKWEMGEYEWMSYREVEAKVAVVAAGLKDAATGEDPKVVIFAETRAHWLITALACFRANIPIVTVYATLGEDAIAHAIDETGSSILITSAELLGKIETLGKRCLSLHTLIYFPPVNKDAPHPNLEPFRKQFKDVLAFKDLLARTNASIKQSTASPEDLALIMYTSGTTGPPKGVMLLQRNIVAAICGQGNGVAIINDTDTYIGYLPLAHILELDAELTSLSCGCKIGYSSPLTLHDRASKIKAGTHGDCHALRPTLMAAVPAIMDRIFKAVSEEVAASPRIMQELFKLNYERKRARYQEGYCSPFLDRIVFKKIRRLLGGKLRGVLSGGAPLNAETQRFMNICMCCPVVQGYGLTETCGAACVADINDLSTGTVGPPVRCCEIVLREWAEGGYSPFNDPPQGEILITGDNVSPGYFKQPEKTAEEFIMYKGKRYFCTGDIGEKRKDGSLIIVDRKKDLVKLQHGEYVSLAKVECALLNCPIIDNVCVYGYGLEANTVALVVPNLKHLEKIAEEVGEPSRDLKTMCRNEKVEAEFLKRLNEHAKKSKLSRTEMPVAIHLCEDIWTPDSGLLTEALKLKRRPLQLKYQTVIDNMYDKIRLSQT